MLTTRDEVADLKNNIRKVVFSRTLKGPDWANTTLVKEDGAGAVRELKKQSDRDMFVFGSANLSATFMNDDLFDEYRLAITPVALGIGKPLFGTGLSRHKLKLLKARPLTSGCVILGYEKG